MDTQHQQGYIWRTEIIPKAEYDFPALFISFLLCVILIKDKEKGSIRYLGFIQV
jgi:hypothetical protein